MKFDFKKELETAAKNMILIHDPDLLIKMTLRMFRQKVKVSHASILLRHKDKDVYIMTVSHGFLSSKIPVGLVRIEKDNPLIRFFREHKEKLRFKYQAIILEDVRQILKKKNIDNELKQLLKSVLCQMEILETFVCIPSYFREDLLGILLLGKKENGKKFSRDELDFFIAVSSNVAMAIENARLFKELELEHDKKQQLLIRIIIALAVAIEAKDYHTHGHTTRVNNLSLEIARKIGQKNKKIFDEKFLSDLHIASLLHDIGKIGVPESILNKKGTLTEEEREKIQEHPLIGVAILKSIKELQDPVLGVKYHHERYDGLGYPEGLRASQIPLIASIISVADSFDAMTSDRPHRPALCRDDAITEIRRLSGAQFHPQVVHAFLELCQEDKI